jgi:hypothetical protein
MWCICQLPQLIITQYIHASTQRILVHQHVQLFCVNQKQNKTHAILPTIKCQQASVT